MNGRMYVRTDERTEGRKDEHAEGWTEGARTGDESDEWSVGGTGERPSK